MTKKSDAIRRAALGVPESLITYAAWSDHGFWWFEINAARLKNEHLYLVLEEQGGLLQCLKVPSSVVAGLYSRFADDKTKYCAKLDARFVDRNKAGGQDLSAYLIRTV